MLFKISGVELYLLSSLCNYGSCSNQSAVLSCVPLLDKISHVNCESGLASYCSCS